MTLELTLKGSGKVVAHACSKCRRVAHNEDAARRCCEPVMCDCGEAARYPYTACDRCKEKKRNDRIRAIYDKAEKISWRDYDGPVYSEDHDRYWGTLEEFADEMEGEEMPAHVFACHQYKLTLNAQDIIDDALESQEHHEDARDHVGDTKKLQATMDEWLAGQSLVSWMYDKSRVILLDGIVEGLWPESKP